MWGCTNISITLREGRDRDPGDAPPMGGEWWQDPRSRDNLYVKGLPLDYTKDGRILGLAMVLVTSNVCGALVTAWNRKAKSFGTKQLGLQNHCSSILPFVFKISHGVFSDHFMKHRRTRRVWLQEDLEEIFKPYGVVKRCRCRLLRCGNGWKVVEVVDLIETGCGLWFSKMNARKLFCLVGQNFWGILASAWDVENSVPDGFSQNLSGTLFPINRVF